MKPGILITALLFPLFAFSQTRLYVNASASGANNGLNWTDAFNDLKNALSVSQAGDTIWVAQGTYRPTPGTERDSAFQLKSNVRLYGGFAGTEISLAQRDWTTYLTVLSGDIGIQGDSTDNSYTILYMESPDSGTVVDGLVFRHGTAIPPSLSGSLFSPRQCGGAIYMMAFDEFAYPIIRNCRFEHNHAAIHGGAVCINGGGGGSVAPQFLDCIFEHNSAGVNGGAVYRRGSSWVERIHDFGNCIFRDNHAGERGGGLHFNDAERTDTMHVSGCQFIQNTANLTGGGANFNLGREEGSTLVIRNCLFESNSSFGLGGGGPYSITSFSFLTTREVIVDSSYFVKNTCTSHLVYDDVLGGKLTIKKSIFSENQCGALLILGGNYDESVILNCLFKNNDINGGFDISSSNFKIVKNVFIEPLIENNFIQVNFLQNADISNNLFLVKNCTFIRDAASWNTITIKYPNNLIMAKKLIKFSSSSNKSRVYFQNSIQIITGSPDEYIDYCQECEVNFINCLLDTTYYCNSLPYVICGPGNLFGLDPMFRDTANGDYSLLPCSPLINAGNNAYVTNIPTDIFDNPRVRFGTVDIGAVEMGDLVFADNSPVVKADCSNSASGSIDASGMEACPPVEYEWSNAPGNNTPILSGLSAGTYSMTATDSKGRTVMAAVTVPAASSPTLQVDGTPISCFGAADAMLSATPLSGKPPFAYLWLPGGTTDSVATGLGPGPVSVTMTDAWGCTATFSFTVPEPDTLQFTATVQDASGQQSADGSIMVNMVMGGTAPYGYLWSPGGSMDDMLDGLLPGFYTLTVTDERGCEAAWTFEVKFISGAGEAGTPAVLFLYPVPAAQSVTMEGEIPGTSPAYLQLYDSDGRLASELSVPDTSDRFNWQVSVESLPAGYYTAYLKDKNGQVIGIGKLVKR